MAAVVETTDERILHPISTTELERRWNAARELMREAGLDALIAQSINNQSGCGYFRWFTDNPNISNNPMTVIFPQDGLMTVFQQGPWGKERKFDGKSVPNRGVGKRVFSPSYPAIQYTGGYDAEIMAREILQEGHKTVGRVCPATWYCSFGEKLKELLKDVKFVDFTDSIDTLKSVKSPEEMDMVRRTCAMQDEVMKRVAQFIKPGMRDFEVYAFAQYQGQLLGSEAGLFLGSSATPPEPAAFKQRWQMGRQIRKGDAFMLLIENSGPGGYYTELARPFFFGKAPRELTDQLDLINEAQQHTVKKLKPGASLPDVWHAHNAFMTSRGKPEEERLYCHGQGYDLVERPLLRHDETRMKVGANMYFACHPEIATEKEFMTLCDNFLVKADGTQERLHKFPQKYIEV